MTDELDYTQFLNGETCPKCGRLISVFDCEETEVNEDYEVKHYVGACNNCGIKLTWDEHIIYEPYTLTITDMKVVDEE